MLIRHPKAVRARESRVLVVRGEPGVDKTALLDALLEQGGDRGQRDLRSHGGGRSELVDEPAGGHAQPNSRITSVNAWQRRDACVPRVTQGGCPQASPR
jgi:hypothetical protein